MEAIYSADAPDAIGTYSQAIRSGHTVYLSGQIPLDPQTMALCSQEIREQVTQVFENIKAVCQAAGGQLADIVKLTIYLTDLAHFPIVNTIMATYFTPPYPARAVIGISTLPRDAAVEMDAILVLPEQRIDNALTDSKDS